MSSEAEIPIRHGFISLLFKQTHAQEVSCGFGHLLLVGDKEIAMHPEVHPWMHSEGGLGLCNLVSVMYRYMINPSGVDIELVTKIF